MTTITIHLDFPILGDFSSYEDLHIISRKPHPVAKEITYGCADASGKNVKNVLLKHINATKVDPFKSLRRFHAILKVSGKEEDNMWEVDAILTDIDWCVRK